MTFALTHPAISPVSRRVLRFLATPKGLLLILLAAFGVLSAGKNAGEPFDHLWLGAMVAAVFDMAFVAVKRNELEFPSGALCTGLIIAVILGQLESTAVVVVSTVVAIASKHLLRTHRSNVLNPAAVGLLFAAVVLNSAQSWWGALPDLGWPGIALLLAAGLFMADRINKLPMVAVFLGSFYLFFTAASFLIDWPNLAEVFRTPDLQAVLFFAFFMLDDPPTCPIRYEDQALYGLVVAFVAYFFFITMRGDYYLIVGLLAGNAFESMRRLYQGRDASLASRGGV